MSKLTIAEVVASLATLNTLCDMLPALLSKFNLHIYVHWDLWIELKHRLELLKIEYMNSTIASYCNRIYLDIIRAFSGMVDLVIPL